MKKRTHKLKLMRETVAQLLDGAEFGSTVNVSEPPVSCAFMACSAGCTITLDLD